MKDSKIDDSLFKSFCDGQLETTQLYKDGQSSFRHYSIPIFTSNNMPNLKVDSGIVSVRILSINPIVYFKIL